MLFQVSENAGKELQQHCLAVYLDLVHSEDLKKYGAINLETDQKIFASDIVGYETCIYGLFSDRNGCPRTQFIETPRPMQSKPEILKRSGEKLGSYILESLTQKSIEDQVFTDWRLSRELMYETANDNGLRFLGAIGVYQLERRSPLKPGVIFPLCYVDWVLEESERIALDIQKYDIEHDRFTDFERLMLVNNPAMARKICANAVIDGLLETRIDEESLTVIESS